MNNDGWLDVVVGNHGRHSNELLLNDGTSNLTVENSLDLPGGSLNTTSLAVGDVNNDGCLDIIGNEGHTKKLLLNDKAGGGFHGGDLAVGHVNNDGSQDIIMGNTGNAPN